MPKGSKKRRNNRKSKQSLPADHTYQDMPKSSNDDDKDDQPMSTLEVVAQEKLPPLINDHLINLSSSSSVSLIESTFNELTSNDLTKSSNDDNDEKATSTFEVVAQEKLPDPLINDLNKLSSSSSSVPLIDSSTYKEDTSTDMVKSDDEVVELIADQMNGMAVIDSEKSKDFVNLNNESIDNIDVVAMLYDKVEEVITGELHGMADIVSEKPKDFVDLNKDSIGDDNGTEMGELHGMAEIDSEKPKDFVDMNKDSIGDHDNGTEMGELHGMAEIVSEKPKEFVDLNKDSIGDDNDVVVVVVAKLDDEGTAISEPVAKVEEISLYANSEPTVELFEPNCSLNQSEVARKQQLEGIKKLLQKALLDVDELLDK